MGDEEGGAGGRGERKFGISAKTTQAELTSGRAAVDTKQFPEPIAVLEQLVELWQVQVAELWAEKQWRGLDGGKLPVGGRGRRDPRGLDSPCVQ